jgi:hypothetical protein
MVLRPALQAVFYLQQRNPQNLTFPDMVGVGSTPYYPYESTNKQQVDFAAGLLLEHPLFQLGAAVQHIGTSANEALPVYGDQPLKITAHGQASIALAGESSLLPLPEWTAFDNVVLLPHAKYIRQLDYRYLVAGVAVRSGGLFAGVAVKTPLKNQTYIGVASVGLETGSLKVGYNFDFLASGGNLRGWNSSSHELFLHYSFGELFDGPRRISRSYKRIGLMNPECGCPY